jgi:hypothetical protein
MAEAHDIAEGVLWKTGIKKKIKVTNFPWCSMK